jgi:hypothetical protein
MPNQTLDSTAGRCTERVMNYDEANVPQIESSPASLLRHTAVLISFSLDDFDR